MADDKRIERIESKLDTISEKLGDTNSILAAQHESLKLHMKRSDALERAIKPLEKHVNRAEGALKLVTLLAAAAAIAEFIKAFR